MRLSTPPLPRRLHALANETPSEVGFLRPLPQHAVHRILSYVGYVKDDNDTFLLVANNDAALQASRMLALRTHDGADEWDFTSFGWYDDQLFPEEFFAFINAEVAANLNLMAEARGRPRPSLLNAAADQDDEKDIGCRAEPADVDDENPSSDKEADDRACLQMAILM